MIIVNKYKALKLDWQNEMAELAELEFGEVPFVKNTKWTTPDWSILKFEGNDLVAFYNIVERDIEVDGQVMKAGGINNVITKREHRGKGLASLLLKETAKLLFEDIHCNLGLLLCADDLVNFYHKHGWYKVNSALTYDQPDGKRDYSSNIMLLTSPEKSIIPKKIDLKGLPW
ncbi:MAG TPA: GNAT family N-acetyltransferase [Chitinophagaceae bacterium]|jgi:GNAT superfamily N-acetyltransferase|nr:GNAT family N-acetyltransferase [Chitinophagaceae bacterium]